LLLREELLVDEERGFFDFRLLDDFVGVDVDGDGEDFERDEDEGNNDDEGARCSTVDDTLVAVAEGAFPVRCTSRKEEEGKEVVEE